MTSETKNTPKSFTVSIRPLTTGARHTHSRQSRVIPATCNCLAEERGQPSLRQANLGVSGSDVYQVLAYAHRYQTERAVLVYPHHPAIGLPGIQREFLTHGAGPPTQVRIRVVTVDLARLDSIPSQLEQAFLSDREALAV